MLTIYTKNYCPFCSKAKTLLDSLNLEYKEIDITDTPEKMEELSRMSGMMTIPQIFLGEKLLGGYSDIEKLNKEGKLLDEING